MEGGPGNYFQYKLRANVQSTVHKVEGMISTGWSDTNSSFILYALLLSYSLISIPVVLTLLTFQASHLSCNKFWVKRAG